MPPKNTRSRAQKLANQFSDADNDDSLSPLVSSSSRPPKQRKLLSGKGSVSSSASVIVPVDDDDGDSGYVDVYAASPTVTEQMEALIAELFLPDKFKECIRTLLSFPFDQCQSFPPESYAGDEELVFLKDIIELQGWGDLLAFKGKIYPFEVIQFMGTVKLEDEALYAHVNGVKVEISVTDFALAFGLSDGGDDITNYYNSLDVAGKVAFKQRFDYTANSSTEVKAAVLNSTELALFKFLYHSVARRHSGVYKLYTHDMVVLDRFRSQTPVNTPLFILDRIDHDAGRLRSGKAGKPNAIPFGSWITHLLELKGVLSHHSFAFESKEDVSSVVLKGLLGIKGKAAVTAGDSDDVWRNLVECQLHVLIAQQKKVLTLVEATHETVNIMAKHVGEAVFQVKADVAFLKSTVEKMVADSQVPSSVYPAPATEVGVADHSPVTSPVPASDDPSQPRPSTALTLPLTIVTYPESP